MGATTSLPYSALLAGRVSTPSTLWECRARLAVRAPAHPHALFSRGAGAREALTEEREQGLQCKVHGAPAGLLPGLQDDLLLTDLAEIKT